MLVFDSACAIFDLVQFDSSLPQLIQCGSTQFDSRWVDSIRVECHRFDSVFTDVFWFGLIHVESCWFHFAQNCQIQFDVIRFVLIPCGSLSFDICWFYGSLFESVWFCPIWCGLVRCASGRIEIIRCYMIRCGLLRFDSAWFNVVRFDSISSHVIQFDLFCIGSIWFDLGLICLIRFCPIYIDLIQWLCLTRKWFDSICLDVLRFGSWLSNCIWFILVWCDSMWSDSIWGGFIWLGVTRLGLILFHLFVSKLLQRWSIWFESSLCGSIRFDLPWLGSVSFGWLSVKTCNVCLFS